VHGQRVDGVRTARRVEAAGRGQPGRDPALVETHRDQCRASDPPGRRRERPAHRRRPADSTRDSAESTSGPSSALEAAAAWGSARTTTSAPAGIRSSRARRRCRSRRCTRCRTTAPPTARLTTKPTRASSRAPGRAKCTTRVPRATRCPRRTAVTKSSRRVSRAAAGSTGAVRFASGRQFGTAPATACGDDGAAGTGTHAQPKPMGPRPATIVRLERALALAHGCPSPGDRDLGDRESSAAGIGLRVVESSS